MGHAPDQVDTWEPYQVMAVYRAWVAANTPEKKRHPTPAQFEAAISGMVH